MGSDAINPETLPTQKRGYFATFATPKPLNHAGLSQVLLTTLKTRKFADFRASASPWPPLPWPEGPAIF